MFIIESPDLMPTSEGAFYKSRKEQRSHAHIEVYPSVDSFSSEAHLLMGTPYMAATDFARPGEVRF